MKNRKVLFVTWDGPEVTYVENLFAPIFVKLQESYGYEFHIIQFTSAPKEKIRERKKGIEGRGLQYLGIPTSNKSAVLGMLKAKYLDIYRIKKYAEKHGIEVLMPRAVNAYFIMESLLKRQQFKLVWDADGFPLEERVDFAGLSKDSWRYRFFRKIELQAYQKADSLICRTQKAKEIFVKNAAEKFDWKKVFVVPNGTFVPSQNPSTVIKPNQLTLVYAGSMGPQYMLEDMLKTFQPIKESFPDAVFKILTFQIENAKSYIFQHYPELLSSISLKSVPADQVIDELRSAHIGVSYRMPSYSMQGVAPIKVSEYLSAGLSVIYNPGIGDLDELLAGQEFAYCLDPFKGLDSEEFEAWVKNQMEKDFSAEVIQFADKHFSLENSAALYHHALQYGEK